MPLSLHNRPIWQITQCIRQISHNVSFCNRNVHICAHFCYKMIHCGIWNRCIVGFVHYVNWFILTIDKASVACVGSAHFWVCRFKWQLACAFGIVMRNSLPIFLVVIYIYIYTCYLIHFSSLTALLFEVLSFDVFHRHSLFFLSIQKIFDTYWYEIFWLNSISCTLPVDILHSDRKLDINKTGKYIDGLKHFD